MAAGRKKKKEAKRRAMNLSKKQVQSEEAWQNQMAEKILRFVQNELYQDLRFLDVALSALVWQPAQGLGHWRRMAVNCTFRQNVYVKYFQTIRCI